MTDECECDEPRRCTCGGKFAVDEDGCCACCGMDVISELTRYQEGYAEGLEAAAALLEQENEADEKRIPGDSVLKNLIRAMRADHAQRIRHLVTAPLNTKPVNPDTGHRQGSAPPCACGHHHLAGTDGEDEGCGVTGCTCGTWVAACPHPLPHYTFPADAGAYPGRVQCVTCGALLPPSPAKGEP